MKTPPMIRALIADENGLSRAEMRDILDRRPDVEVVGEAKSGAELRSFLDALTPDVLIIDLAFHEPDPFETARRASSNGGRPRVLIVAQRNDSRYVARAIHAGAAGYVLKDRAYEELGDAVRAASRGIYISPGIAGIGSET